MGQMLLTGAGGGASNVLASVPWVAQWKFNNNGNDSIGANNLTNNNSATFTTGLLGGATGATQLVDASNQSWSIADNAALSMGTGVDWFIGMWLYADTTAGAHTAISKNGTVEYFIDFNDGTMRLYANNAAQITTGITITTGAWHCLMVWYNGSTYSASYDNGTPVTGGTGDTPDGTGALYVGSRADAIHLCWDGRIDNVCIAKSAAGAGGVLSAAQRTAFYNAGVGTETLS